LGIFDVGNAMAGDAKMIIGEELSQQLRRDHIGATGAD